MKSFFQLSQTVHPGSTECWMLTAVAKNYSKSVLQLQIKIRLRTYKVVLCRFCVNIVSINAKRCFPFYCCWRQQYTVFQNLSYKYKMGFPLHCCTATKYFVLLLKLKRIKYSECVSIFLPYLSGMHIEFFRGTSVACLAVTTFFDIQ
jgi:hypothetical protein